MATRDLKRVVTDTAVTATASMLREKILSENEVEFYLGSEDDLMASLGISRATLRQAARLLEHEQLLFVRRGSGGGLFGRQPTGTAVTHMASVYLRANGTTYGELIRCQTALGTASAQMAAEFGTPEGKAALVDYYASRVSEDELEAFGGQRFGPLAGGFQVALAHLTGSVPLQLFVQVLMDLALPVGARVLDDPKRMQVTIRRHTAVAEAVARGEGDLAAERMRHHLEMMLTWTDESVRIGALDPSGR